jgi:hypothetical protein
MKAVIKGRDYYWVGIEEKTKICKSDSKTKKGLM